MPPSTDDAVESCDVDDKPDCVPPVEAEGAWIIAPADGSTRNGGGNCVASGGSGATDVGIRVAAGLESMRFATDDDPAEEGATDDGLAEYGAAVNVEAVFDVGDGEAGATMGERETTGFATTGFATTCPTAGCRTPALPAAPTGGCRVELPLPVADHALPVLGPGWKSRCDSRCDPRLRWTVSLCSRIDARVGTVRPELI